VYSSQNESDKTDDTTETTKSRKTKNETVPKLVDALSMCYVGCLLLRLPVSINDIHTWAASGELLYYRAVKSLSESMKARLPFNYYKIMDPQDMLDPVNLQQAVLDNVTAYDRAFGMITPPINHILLLYRWIRQLALPLEVYSATLRLAKLLDIEFVYDVQPVRTTRYKVMQYAEARLMGMLVVATKLLFPLDNIKRFPKNPTELSALTMDWAAWSKARVEYNETTKDNARLGYQDAMQMQEKDVIDLSNEKLDDYMDWFGTMFTEETVRETGRVGKEAEFRRTLHRFFPIERVVEEEKTDYMDVDEEPRPNTKTKTVLEDERLKKVQERLKPVRIEESKMNEISDTKRPGNGYKRYRHVKELDGHAREFYEEASTMAALSLELLVKCVFVLEIRLEKWEKSERDK
jgi:RNA polymerase I-specific transcription initiation factor RRN7